jgi:outer membrane protein OmpA-like peptidoglycan-associated protein
MKRIFAMFAVLALVAGMAMAAPSMYGSNGLIRTISPTNCGPMSWSVGARGFMSMGEIDSVISWMNVDAVPSVNFSFSDMLELSVAPTYGFQQTKLALSKYTGAGLADSSFWYNGSRDTRFGLKATFIRGEGFNFGTYLGYDFRWSKKFNTAYYSWDGSAYVKDSAYSPMGAIHFVAIPGFDMGAAKLNLNVGLDYDLDKYEVGTPVVDYVYPKMAIPFGLGFSYKASDMLTPFVEVTGSYVMDTNYYHKAYVTTPDSVKRGLMNNPMWVTGGLRFAFGNVKLDVGGEYNLQTSDSTLPTLDRMQDWQVFMGLSYGVCNLGPKVPVTAILTGKVTDAKGKGLAATVTAGGLTANTDPATGIYTIAGLPITKLPTEIKAVAKLYNSKSGSVILAKKNKKVPAVQDFALDLTPIPPSEITGNLIDYKTGLPVAATLTFKDAKGKVQTAKTDAKGAYIIKLEQGKYDAQVTAEGYNPNNFVINAADGKPASKNVSLVKMKEVFSFNNINFASGKAVITPEIEKALQPLLKVLLDNPDMKVEIAGHTDAIGSKVKNLKLSQDRADAVVAWLITNNVKAVMTSKGYGSSMPVADNKTKANRALNRRIEIKVAE